MYLARYDAFGKQWLQGCVRLPPHPSSAQRHSEWQKCLCAVLNASAQYPGVRQGLRLELRRQAVCLAFFALAEATLEPQLRKLLASFTRLNTIVEDSGELPATMAAHDAIVQSFPKYRALLTIPDYRLANGLWIGCNLAGWPSVGEWLEEGARLGYSFAYQINLEPCLSSADRCRAAKRNAAKVADVEGAPRELIALQEQLAALACSSSHLIDEVFGVEDEEAGQWLSAVLGEDFHRQFGATKLPAPELEFEEDGCEEQIVATLNRMMMAELPVQQVCSSLIDASQPAKIYGLFSETSSFYTADTIATVGVDATLQSQLQAAVSIPDPYPGKGEYFFISYRHDDLPQVSEVLQQLSTSNVAFWYDRGIPGGTEWDEVIEERIQSSLAVLLFLSDAAIESKWVRREAKFADAITKPIIMINLGVSHPAHGMALLMNQYQMIDAAREDYHSQLMSAIRHALDKS